MARAVTHANKHRPLAHVPGAYPAPCKRVDHGGRRWLVQYPDRAWIWTADGVWLEHPDPPAPVLEAAASLARVKSNGREPGEG